MIRFLTILILLSFIYKAAYPKQSETLVFEVFKHIYNQQFHQAESLLESEKNQIDPFYFDVLRIDLSWWKSVFSESNDDSKYFQSVLKDVAENNQGVNQEYKITKLILLSYRLRFELKRYNIIGAALLRSEIKNLLLEINPTDLNYGPDRLKLFHLYRSLFDYFDSLINPFFLNKKRTARTKALSEIEHFTRNGDLVVSTLSSYFLGKIYFNIEEKHQKGITLFKNLSTTFPQNTLFRELSTQSESKS